MSKFQDNYNTTPPPNTEELRAGINLDRQVKDFVDVSGVSTRFLDLSLWYMEHKKFLFLLTVWFLALFAAVLWSFCLYYFTYYLLVGVRQDRENELALSEALVTAPRQLQGWTDLQKVFIKALPIGQDRYDLAGQVINPNQDIWATFDYYFLIDGVPTERQSSFVFPGETKTLISVGQTLPSTPSNGALVLERVGPDRFKARDMPDWPTFKEDHLKFLVQDKIFTPYTQTGLTEKLPINRLSFSLINQTAFNYRQAKFNIMLYQGNNLLAVDNYIVSDFMSKEKKNITLSILGSLSTVNRIDIVPDINIINSSEYKSGY
ncbi:hypothetical protein COT94_03405 [Candidatus Falkowbacteria bacterium CG10_big_fil_rev_8_21_14_0_10_37_14]|uniref:Uncharacterized protein n=1 Tax=Candidatus Falkowbacteria bacterium CG10_big_fil_rev_8_21_14_0_10_37_14 TaxID=1974561 RepID=A0A2M6WT29_9BACT|nr:hypothetical protein [Candidatus Falkowbacteria bacterium]PIT95866.1 MAG: hypothetical protein COT94_03405 [Candidatus Falkowbacteria bacterium CG10_big_fil_rev_8_21_14_0_10_37_14]